MQYQEKLLISTELAPKAIGPYSQAVKVGGLVFTSGQIPIDPETGKLVKGDIKVQARRSLDNIKALVEAAGATLENVLKVTIFLTDMEDFSKVNEVYGLYFDKNHPARSTVAVVGLPLGAKIEIECIAKVG